MTEKIKLCILSFLDALLECFPTNTNLMLARICCFQCDNDLLNEHLIHNIDKDKIQSKNEQYLLHELKLFENICVQTSNQFVFEQIWFLPEMDDENKLMIWKWMLVIVRSLFK